MESPLGKDPQELNKNMLGGKKWWQYLCLVLSFLIAVIFTLVFKNSMGSSLNSIACAVLVLPLGYVGVFSKNGLDFFEYYSKKAANARGDNVFLYVHNPVTENTPEIKNDSITSPKEAPVIIQGDVLPEKQPSDIEDYDSSEDATVVLSRQMIYRVDKEKDNG